MNNQAQWNYDFSEVPKGHYVEAVMLGLVPVMVFCDWQGGFHRISDGQKLDVSGLVSWRPLVDTKEPVETLSRHEPAKVVKRTKQEGYHGFTV